MVSLQLDQMTQQFPHLSSEKASKIQEAFQNQLEHFDRVGRSSPGERRKKLKSIEKWLLHHRQDILDALHADFSKPSFETDFSDIYMVLAEIRHTRKRLRRWMRDEPVRTPIAFTGTRSWIRRESKGVCMVIGAWNFPVNLSLGPVISAIAAGNCVILKPSEKTPATAELLDRMAKELFDPAEFTVIQGGIPESQDLLRLPFHHIFFTGSTEVGKIVMKAAAENLTSVTLELGGKCPTIVDGTSSLKVAAKRVAWGKFFNAGQTCVAPDYVLVKREVKDAFQAALETQIQNFYGGETLTNADFSNVVDDAAAERIAAWSAGKAKRQGAHIPPTLISDPDLSSPLLNEEIFGPVLPLLAYDSEEEVFDFINQRERPISVYVFSRNKRFIRQVMNNTRSGSFGIRLTVAPFGQNELPFGGVNHSGMGRAHGYAGFEAFSNKRSIMKSTLPLNYHALVAPPYNGFKKAVMKFLMRWL